MLTRGVQSPLEMARLASGPVGRRVLSESDRKIVIEFLKQQEAVKRILQRIVNDNAA